MTDAAPFETAPAGKPAAVWEDFVDVFTSPSAVFERRRARDYALGVTLLATLSALVFVATRSFLQPYFEHQMQAGLAMQVAAGKITAQQLEQVRGVMEKTAGVGIWASGLLATPIAVLVVAGLTLGAAYIVGARLTYGQALVVATLAYVPRLLETAANAGILALKDPDTFALGAVPASPAALLDPNTSMVLAGFLNRLDPFVLWSTILIGIGVAVLGRVSRAKGFQAAAFVWGVATLVAVGNALRTVAAAS